MDNSFPSIFDPAIMESLRFVKQSAALQKSKANNSDKSNQVSIYLRVSSDMQREGFSIEAQRDICLEYVNRNKLKVEEQHIYIDEAYSAKDDSRPVFLKMMADAENGYFSRIIVHKMDRFMRNLSKSIESINKLSNIGVSVFCIHENMELTDSLICNVLAAVNQHYLKNLSDETAKGKRKMARTGYHIGSIVPTGYMKVKDTREIVIIEETREIFHEMFELYATGTYSVQDITDWLNSKNIKSYRQRAFCRDTVLCILQNPFYAGYVVYKGDKNENAEIIQGRHPALISNDLFIKTQMARIQRRKTRRTIQKNSNQIKERYLLQGILCCQQCERKLRVKSVRNNCNVYIDNSAERGLDCSNNKKSIRTNYVHDQIKTLISHIELPHEWVSEIEKFNSETTDQDKIADEIKSIQLRIERRERAYTVLGKMNTDQFTSDTQEDLRLIQKLKNKITVEAPAKQQMLACLSDSFMDYFFSATAEEQYDILHLLFDSIFYDFLERKIVAFSPNDEFLFLFLAAKEKSQWEYRENKFYLPEDK